jgi:eukaryotic-like serine/threonine-protein kinase
MLETAAIPKQLPCPKCGYLADPSTGAVNFCPKCGRDLRQTESQDDALSQAWVGRVIAERYRLIAPLGEGGMGAVYKAEHIRMGKTLALKLLRGTFAADPGAVGRFRGEAQIVSRLSHPHTIAVFDFGELSEGGFYLAMEYVPGKDLATVLDEQRTLPEARAATIGEQLLGSLGEAHDAGIVHRDIKPANVMLMATRSGEDFVKVLDFGIAKLRDAPGTSSNDTSAGAIIGTPNYLSPEQARGDVLDARADLYSVGALLYELVSGRCPFVAPNPMAVVSAHLTQKPQSLRELAPTVSEAYAAIVHRALEKKPEDRFGSADEMRAALLRLGESSSADTDAPLPRQTTGELQIASRQDFADLERQIANLKRSRVMAPFSVLVLVVLVVLGVWRWPDLYGLLRRRAPMATENLPAALRPADFYDGVEHEPNDSPAQANPLPIPPGPDGQPAGGVAQMVGHIGARISDTNGDVDVFRIEVPKMDRPLALHAEWHGSKTGEGIPGLDVALTLNRDRGGDSSRRSALLIASVDRGGPGRPEELVAAVRPSTYYLAVREKHPENAAPVEKPAEEYHLKVWLAAPQPGEEIEPNDQPEAVENGYLRYPQWKELAERNPLGEGRSIRGTTSPDDPDTYSISPRGPADAPELVAVVPDPGLALTARYWVPDAEDLGPLKPRDRVGFKAAGESGPGEVLFVRLGTAPRSEAPVLLQLRASSGEGRYDIVALGQSSSSGPAVLALLQTLEKDGHAPQALELAAGFVRILPRSTARDDVLLSAGKLAERIAPAAKLASDPAVERASRLLGEAVFEKVEGRQRYAGAFESQVRVGGDGRSAEEASWRLISRATPCTAADVERRASFFLTRFGKSVHAAEARLWLARAQEEEFRLSGSREALRRAVDSYRMLTATPGEPGAEARRRLKALEIRKPVRAPTSRLHCK